MITKQILNINFSRILIPFLGVLTFLITSSNIVLAQNISDIAGSMVATSAELPGLITGIAYLIGAVFSVHGIIKAKDHVENPSQTALRYPLISLLIGGSMFSLPIVYESMATLISPQDAGFGPGGGLLTSVSGLLGTITGALPIQMFGTILTNIVDSVEKVPGLLTGVAYMLGLVMGVAGLLKIKEHVEEPSRTPMKDGIVRLIVGGMLFSIPAVYSAMISLIAGGGGTLVGDILSGGYMVATSGGLASDAPGGGCVGNAVGNAIGALGGGGGGMSLGSVVCNLFMSTSPFLAFLTAIAYLFGLVVGLWGILKIKDHVENPTQTMVWDPVAKIVVAGGFFALPYVVSVAYTSIANLIVPHSNSLNGEVRLSAGPAGLDGMIGALMNDTFMPMTVIINWFALVAGFILVFIGISRLMKSAQEGAKGPGGIGTIMTFVTGGALLAFSPMITSLSASLFAADGITTPNVGTLRYTAGMSPDAIARAHTVIDAVILFIMLIGFISVARGIFIMRGVSEGNSQASSMAGITHLVGGAMAVNLAPLLNTVQTTLGINNLGLGINFAATGGGGGGLLGLIGGLF